MCACACVCLLLMLSVLCCAVCSVIPVILFFTREQWTIWSTMYSVVGVGSVAVVLRFRSLLFLFFLGERLGIKIMLSCLYGLYGLVVVGV